MTVRVAQKASTGQLRLIAHDALGRIDPTFTCEARDLTIVDDDANDYRVVSVSWANGYGIVKVQTPDDMGVKTLTIKLNDAAVTTYEDSSQIELMEGYTGRFDPTNVQILYDFVLDRDPQYYIRDWSGHGNDALPQNYYLTYLQGTYPEFDTTSVYMSSESADPIVLGRKKLTPYLATVPSGDIFEWKSRRTVRLSEERAYPLCKNISLTEGLPLKSVCFVPWVASPWGLGTGDGYFQEVGFWEYDFQLEDGTYHRILIKTSWISGLMWDLYIDETKAGSVEWGAVLGPDPYSLLGWANAIGFVGATFDVTADRKVNWYLNFNGTSTSGTTDLAAGSSSNVDTANVYALITRSYTFFAANNLKGHAILDYAVYSDIKTQDFFDTQRLVWGVPLHPLA